MRSGLAKHYLTDTDLRLEQIAYLTGYSEPAALVRAFRRWTRHDAHAIPGKALLVPEYLALPVNLCRRRLMTPIGLATSLGIDPRRSSSQVNKLSSKVNAGSCR